MDNNALAAALGRDARAAVRGYRAEVVAQARGAGLVLVEQPGSLDTLDIALVVAGVRAPAGVSGRTLRWSAAHGWSVAHRGDGPARRHLAGADATPLDLVPTAAEVVAWVAAAPAGPRRPPAGVELDDDPAAITRLLAHADLDHHPALRPGDLARS
jgi:hypothetical protein